MGIAAPVAAVAAVALGACLIEKHLTLCRADGGPDSAFSLEPDEFRTMVAAVRQTEMALGAVNFEPTEKEKKSRIFRRSLFVVQDMRAGQEFTLQNTASIRPSHGLHPRYLDMVIGRRAAVDIPRGTPLSWELVGEVKK
jgi:pseudaminic acid synthase